jgi:uncharacterized protein (TIGR00290 family)
VSPGTNAVLSWSGGKDSSLTLNEIRLDNSVNVVGLLTTITSDYDRISMHGVRRSLARQQASSIGLPLFEVPIPKRSSNEIYEKEMEKILFQLKKEHSVSAVIFGDLFLRDIREYREKLLSRIGMECLFPLWMRNTSNLADAFIDLGFRAIICTVDPRKLDAAFCGRDFDRSFLSELPTGVDPCGENGEFHTFVHSGPIYDQPISVMKGQIVQRDGFYFADIIQSEDS